MRIRTIARCVFVVVAFPVAAVADHFPFTEGVVYEYQRIPQTLGTFSTWFSGTAEIGGATTYVRHADDGQQQFWSETPEGDKYFHGTAFRLEPPVIFSPAILAIDEPLFVGKTWDMDIEDSDGFTFHIRHDVIAFGDVMVPAGTFQAFTIRQIVEFTEPKRSQEIRGPIEAIWGLIQETQQVSDRSYADGVGQILVTFGSRTDQLLSFGTVGVEPSTWTQVRMLFR